MRTDKDMEDWSSFSHWLDAIIGGTGSSSAQEAQAADKWRLKLGGFFERSRQGVASKSATKLARRTLAKSRAFSHLDPALVELRSGLKGELAKLSEAFRSYGPERSARLRALAQSCRSLVRQIQRRQRALKREWDADAEASDEDAGDLVMQDVSASSEAVQSEPQGRCNSGRPREQPTSASPTFSEGQPFFIRSHRSDESSVGHVFIEVHPHAHLQGRVAPCIFTIGVVELRDGFAGLQTPDVDDLRFSRRCSGPSQQRFHSVLDCARNLRTFMSGGGEPFLAPSGALPAAYRLFRAWDDEGRLSAVQARLLTCLYARLVRRDNWQADVGAWVLRLPYSYDMFDFASCSGTNCHSFASSFVYQPQFLFDELCKAGQ